MNIKKVLHFLIVVELVSVSLNIIIGILLQNTLFNEIQEYIIMSQKADITYLHKFAFAFGMFHYFFLILAWIALWKFSQDARLIYTLCWLCKLPYILLFEPIVYYTPVGALFSEVDNLSAGMIFGIIYFSELKLIFVKKPT